jgi:ribonuclease PH
MISHIIIIIILSIYVDCINLDEYPRMIIYVKICIIRDDGSMVSVALNAASLALIDSGMYAYMYMIS